MKYLKKFENNEYSVIYLIQDVNENTNERKSFAFYDVESMNNFIVNYIHNKYKEEYEDDYYEDIKNIFSAEELLKEYNIEDSYIKIYDVPIMSDVKLDEELELKKQQYKYNL